MFGAYPQTSGLAAAAAVPVFAWEISLATYLIIKGFKADALYSSEHTRLANSITPTQIPRLGHSSHS